MYSIFPALMLMLAIDPADTSDVEQIGSLLRLQAASWNKGDIAGYMAGYWNSDSLIFTSGGKINRGWDETYRKYAARYDTREKMGTLTFSDIEVHRLSGASAWVLGRWELARASDRPNGVFTLVVRKFDGGWRIVHDHTSARDE